MGDTQELGPRSDRTDDFGEDDELPSPRSDRTDDVSEDDGLSSPRSDRTDDVSGDVKSDRTNDYSDDDGRLSEEFFSDDECSADPPFVATPPPASPPPAEAPVGHLLPECTKCAAKLADLFDKMEKAYCMFFDQHGVAVIPKVTSCRDRGTVTIRTHCSCPKVTHFTFSEAAYQSLFV